MSALAELLARYRDGSADPADVVEQAYERARGAAQPAWIEVVPWRRVRAWLAQLRSLPVELPLYGVPFAIKDNIDLAGVPTTAGCPAYAYTPQHSATAVARLAAAGAIPLGKTNLDQFATGLTGTRSPYGACASVVDPRYVSGGSSSGSAVVVADGTVPFALGTDTAGSGRVPAAFNGIVGLKPTRGLVGTTGVVPACRSLDCVSLLTTSVADATAILDVLAGDDPSDPFARVAPAGGGSLPWPAQAARIAVPSADQLRFGGDASAQRAWRDARRHAVALGWTLVEIDFAPFDEAARMLYDGPWVAERFAAVGDFIAANPAAVDRHVRAVIMAGRDRTAAEAFAAAHRLAELAHVTRPLWASVDALLVPTTPTHVTAAEVADDPIARNALLGRYTNFVNLLDLCAVAVPAAARDDGLPFGVTLVAPAWSDAALAQLAAHWCGDIVEPRRDAGRVELAVVGAHLSGEPLNDQLVALGAQLVETTATAATYRLFELPGGEPAKPGMIGGADGGGAIEVEVWSLDVAAFGRLVAAVPPPLAIGTVTLADGRAVKGFLCEADALRDAAEITAHGGWRAYRAAARGAPAS